MAHSSSPRTYCSLAAGLMVGFCLSTAQAGEIVEVGNVADALTRGAIVWGVLGASASIGDAA